MTKCSIIQCSARKDKNRPQLTLHRLPRNEKMKKRWLEIIGSENLNPQHRLQLVCSLHFEPSCFNRTLDVVRLRDEALPFPFRPMQELSKSRVKEATSSLETSKKSRVKESTSSLETSKKSGVKESTSSLETSKKSVVKESTSSLETSSVPFPKTSAEKIQELSKSLVEELTSSLETSSLPSPNTSGEKAQEKPGSCGKSERQLSFETSSLDLPSCSAKMKEVNQATATEIKTHQQAEQIKKLKNINRKQKMIIKSLKAKVMRRNTKIALLTDILKRLRNKNRNNNE